MTLSSMSVYVIAIFVILLNTSIENMDDKTFVISLKTTKLTITQHSYVKYQISSSNYYIIQSRDIKSIRVDGSSFFWQFEHNRSKARAELKCKLYELKDEIKFSGCKLWFQESPNHPIMNYSIEYTLKLNKNTKYYLMIKIEFMLDSKTHAFTFSMSSSEMTFEGYTQKYYRKLQVDEFIKADLESTDLISDLEQYGGSKWNDSDPSNPSKTNETTNEDDDEVLNTENEGLGTLKLWSCCIF
ncbi:hypothetical protein RF11_12037 [Thelohanellus kitauei]|uniref:Uncharacterized protein n=1 Tax=Thelohanellus kitauei TaxID=669202 RepID=A0A0C2N4D7_THEKT|nr:hypothetical protein RF11_12037 [Thelohanellus kitauei]